MADDRAEHRAGDRLLAAAMQAPEEQERALANDEAIVDELCKLLHRKRVNAIEIRNMAFILRHRSQVQAMPGAAEALNCVERYGKELVEAGAQAAVDEEARTQALTCLEKAARLLGAEAIFERHAHED